MQADNDWLELTFEVSNTAIYDEKTSEALTRLDSASSALLLRQVTIRNLRGL